MAKELLYGEVKSLRELWDLVILEYNLLISHHVKGWFQLFITANFQRCSDQHNAIKVDAQGKTMKLFFPWSLTWFALCDTRPIFQKLDICFTATNN
jgi:hypothetical protein